jgi:hypothetical protein
MILIAYNGSDDAKWPATGSIDATLLGEADRANVSAIVVGSRRLQRLLTRREAFFRP